MVEDTITVVRGLCVTLEARCVSLQNPDGGIKAYHTYDPESGIWSTAETIHLLCKAQSAPPIWTFDAVRYLMRWQNPDGGWPFRESGKSITDITAWACLALSHTDNHEALVRGVRFILAAQRNEIGQSDPGWGLTTFETDRVYSTHIALYCIGRLLRTLPEPFDRDLRLEMTAAIATAKKWLLSIRNEDGGWGAAPGSESRFCNTAFALLALFMQGEDPKDFRGSWAFLESGLADGLWPKEADVVVTREGYELAQEWFTSAFCFRALIFFAEMEVAPLEVVDTVFQSFKRLISAEGDVRPELGAHAQYVWTIAYAFDSLQKYVRLLQAKKKEFAAYFEKKRQRFINEKRTRLVAMLHDKFPYPISYAFSQFEHELDYHRKFQLLLQLYEVVIKYAAIVSLSGHLSERVRNERVAELLKTRLARPSLGDWALVLETFLSTSSPLPAILKPLAAGDISKARSNYLEAKTPKTNLSQELSAVVAMRNQNTGHGAMRSLFEYKQLVEAEESILYTFIDRFSYLATFNSFLVLAADYDEFGEGDRYRIRSFNGLSIEDSDLETTRRLSEGQREEMIRYIYFQNTESGAIVNLYPFLSFTFCGECKHQQFFFYNGRKREDSVSYLSYACGHQTTTRNAAHFAKRLNAYAAVW